MCCDMSGSMCVSPDPCKMESTYLEAVYICSGMGLRLCSENDNIEEVCCNAGCGVDSKLMWISDTESEGTFHMLYKLNSIFKIPHLVHL